MYDPDGHFPILALAIGIGIGAITSFGSVINFTIGAAFSAAGLWNSLKNPQFMNDYSTLRVLGLGKCGGIFGASLTYFARMVYKWLQELQ